MKKLATAIAVIALIGTPALAQAPPPAPVPNWTGFYGGIQFGVGWSDEAVNYLPNDLLVALLLSGGGAGGLPGQQPVASGYRIRQSGLVGGFEAGYNWQWSNLLLGLEADFSFAGMSGTAGGTSIVSTLGLVQAPPPVTQTTTAEQDTRWYGTVRGRAGWLVTPNLLLFGSGGFAYGKVDGSANYSTSGRFTESFNVPPFSSFICFAGIPCFTGSSSAIRTGWTAGGGAEWLLDQHWSAKIEYQFVDLGTETVRITSTPCTVATCGTAGSPSSFNAAFHDRFNVVRLGLNYRF